MNEPRYRTTTCDLSPVGDDLAVRTVFAVWDDKTDKMVVAYPDKEDADKITAKANAIDEIAANLESLAKNLLNL